MSGYKKGSVPIRKFRIRNRLCSIGSNLRRIEALTGAGTLERVREEEALLEQAAALLRVRPDELPSRLERELEERRAIDYENARRMFPRIKPA